MIKIVLGSDHAGYELKEYIKKSLIREEYDVIDLGTNSQIPVDYPDYIIPAAIYVTEHKAEYGIVFGGSGNGEAITANKVKGIRCALCWNGRVAKLAKEHNNANMISLGARVISKRRAKRIVFIWLKAQFKEGRHLQRIQKIDDYEDEMV
jgi:ribose 5-phosphate isomerase B